MSIQTALDEYNLALKQGQKEYRELVMEGRSPYPAVLDDILPENNTDSVVDVGLVEIPSERIIGTKSAGRISAFTASFCPLLDSKSEFATKWVNLCAAHLGETGITGPILCGVVLLLSFFAGMTVARGVVSIFFSAVSSLTGVSLAGSASSMNQGINYVAGRIAPSVGGVTVLCQLISMLVPVLVSGIYLLGICKVPFSWPVIFGLVSIPSIPSAVAALAGMLLSLLSPWLTIVCVLCGMAFSYLQLGALLQYVTGRSEQQLFLPKTACILLSLLLTLLLHLLIGGGLMGNVMNYMIQLLSNVGSLL